MYIIVTSFIYTPSATPSLTGSLNETTLVPFPASIFGILLSCLSSVRIACTDDPSFSLMSNLCPRALRPSKITCIHNIRYVNG